VKDHRIEATEMRFLIALAGCGMTSHEHNDGIRKGLEIIFVSISIVINCQSTPRSTQECRLQASELLPRILL
jgi:hypothetical protein